MPDIDIPCKSQIFDVAFHPKEQLVFAGLLSGRVKAFNYNDEGGTEEKFSVRPAKRSCRALALNEDGTRLYASGKSKAFHVIDVETAQFAETREEVHDAPVNRIEHLTPTMFISGDDDGVVKFWDTRKPEPLREFTHHFDYITDFLPMQSKRQVLVSSGDGTLSVLDYRSSKKTPLAHSEDQEDELLSLVPIVNKGTTKIVVGTQLGVLHVFDPAKGWADCVDRITGHPHSIDALAALPPSYPSGASTILTGSSDGIVRLVEIYPQKPAGAVKLHGQIVDHGEFPVEVIRVDREGKGQAHWIASAGHEEVLRLTDLRSVLEEENGDGDGDGDGDEDGGEKSSGDDDDEDEQVGGEEDADANSDADEAVAPSAAAANTDSEEEEEGEEEKLKERRKRRREHDPLATAEKSKKRRGRGELVDDPSFYAGL